VECIELNDSAQHYTVQDFQNSKDETLSFQGPAWDEEIQIVTLKKGLGVEIYL
jgi:hypothetical protein